MRKMAEFPQLQWLYAETVSFYAAVLAAIGLAIIFALCIYVFAAVLMG